MPLKSKGKSDKAKALQAEEEDSEEISKDEDELSLLSKRVNQLWNKRQTKFKGYKRTGGQYDLTSRQKKSELARMLLALSASNLNIKKISVPSSCLKINS